ncbi:MAG: hypothetical protein ABIW82_04320 [Dokdonella sp.]
MLPDTIAPTSFNKGRAMQRPSIMAAAILAIASSFAVAAQPSAQATFDELKTLEGNWQSTSGKTTVNYKLIANGSSLVETWTMSPTRQSMTVYTMDGDRIIATHYCPQGNAPRLQLASTAEDGTHFFEFLDGANLGKPEGSHEHAFWVRLDGKGTLVRNETYIANGATYDPKKDVGSVEAFVRVK